MTPSVPPQLVSAWMRSSPSRRRYQAPWPRSAITPSPQCLDAGLLDEIVLHIAPVLLGSGVRLFGDEGAEQVELERVSVGGADQLTDLRFRVRSE
jgi:RibD C-terminal domain